MKKLTSYFLSLVVLTTSINSCRKTTTTCSNSLNNNSCTDNSISIDTSKINRKVLFIGIDGFRSDAMQESITPFMHQLSEQSNVFYNDRHTVEDYTVSGPNWTSILTGVHWCKHQVVNNEFNDNNLNDYPSFFQYIENADNSINTASIVNWTPINEFLGTSYADHAPENSINDAEVYQLAEDVLVNQNPMSPDILFLQFDEPDAKGHGYGFSASIPEYAQCLTQTDAYVQQLFNIIDNKRANGEDWLILIVSDHGGDGTGHGNGQNNEHIVNTIFYAQHPTLSFSDICSSNQADLIPTILDFMGITSQAFNCKTDGVSLFN